MKVFVTGATGVVGTRALAALADTGHELTAVARGPQKEELVRTFGAKPVRIDLFDADAVRAAVVGHEAVINLATNIPPLRKATSKRAWRTNERLRREASNHLVDGALAAGAAHYVQESICFPYLDGGEAWLHEDAPIRHDGVFAGAAVAEAATARFAGSGAAGVVLRFAQFHGPGSSHVASFNALARRRINPFVGPPDGYVSFIHADDAGAAVAAALSAPSGTYNIGDNEPLTRRDAGAAIAEALGVKPPRSLPALMRATLPRSAKALMRSLRVSNAHFRTTTGWEPAHVCIRGSWAA